jgi:hypothetical protein
MKKGEKNNILHTLDLLLQAETILEKDSRVKASEEMADLLQQMQEGAIQAGNIIEKSEGEGSAAVKQLEDVCELIYQISVTDPYKSDYDIRTLKLKRALRDVRSYVSKIRARREVLFLPYQVSMWDSLESVWKAADADPDTDAYVVPLPVYDVNCDGTLGELHYEGNSYPDYVPVIGFDKYDIEARHPDIIFIHNPYDGCNTVTRIPEKYYSSNLRKYTDMLVYIPYLVSEEDGPADQQCYTPGVLFSDRVIVQSGSVYEKYCRVYTQALIDNGWTDELRPAKEKFLPLGSPKFDKLMNTKCGPDDLPESWKRIVFRSDGTKKKVIFYNMSITALLENSDNVIRKMDYVFRTFKKEQDDVVLLWRPHPLLLKTIDSMRPQLHDDYLKRVKQFKEEGWGIFDDTPDPDLGMVLSDAYYGDESSLVVTYRATGKPIMLQDMNIIDDEED